MTNGFNKDLYGILNLKYDATTDEIKASYKKLARTYHPDVAGKDSDAEKFKEIREAYEILSSEQKRKRYDALHGYFSEKLKREYKEKQKNTSEYEDILKKARSNAEKSASFSESVNDALDNLFGKARKSKYKKQEKTLPSVDGEDIETEVKISAEEALNGTSRRVNILHTEPCPKCGGRKFINEGICEACNGTGQVSKQRRINVKIPASVSADSKVRVKGEGNKGINGGKDGDLYLRIDVEKSEYYDTKDLDVICSLPITPWEAVFGCEVTLTVKGSAVNVKIPPMTSSGQKLKLKELGLENRTLDRKGDIIINVLIKLPENLSEKERTLYSELKELSTGDIRSGMKKCKTTF